MYGLLRPFLFGLDPEQAHHLTLCGLDAAHRSGLSPLFTRAVPSTPVTAMGLTFPNALGLAAGLDKNGEHIDALAALGFGFIEIGTVTPRPQPGNPKPRMFRLPQANALINRLGFNNDGVERLVENVKRAKYRGILGINIGKNFDTPIEEAERDYLLCLERVYPYASYITVNISSPNTKNLRQLQSEDALDRLLGSIVHARDGLAIGSGRRVPLAVKIAPDLSGDEVRVIAALLLSHHIDAVIATNTTIARDAVQGLPHAEEAGGLSGAPVFAASNAVIRQLAQELQGRIPIIGVGGILSGADAREKINAGATLLQVYTGLIYRGPELIASVLRELARRT